MKLDELLGTEYKDVKKAVQTDIALSKNAETLLTIFAEELADLIREESDENYKRILMNKQVRDLFEKEKPIYESIDITAFCFGLSRIEKLFNPKNETGPFPSRTYTYLASAFINQLIYQDFQKTKRKEEYNLVTSHLEIPLHMLCLGNYANVHIIGNVGTACCSMMHEGTVLIEGNSEDDLCSEMRNGTVILKGNAKDRAGRFLSDGVIVIYGNAGKKVGENMHDGTIHILGEYESVGNSSYPNKGKIYHTETRVYALGQERKTTDAQKRSPYTDLKISQEKTQKKRDKNDELEKDSFEKIRAAIIEKQKPSTFSEKIADLWKRFTGGYK